MPPAAGSLEIEIELEICGSCPGFTVELWKGPEVTPIDMYLYLYGYLSGQRTFMKDEFGVFWVEMSPIIDSSPKHHQLDYPLFGSIHLQTTCPVWTKVR